MNYLAWSNRLKRQNKVRPFVSRSASRAARPSAMWEPAIAALGIFLRFEVAKVNRLIFFLSVFFQLDSLR